MCNRPCYGESLLLLAARRKKYNITHALLTVKELDVNAPDLDGMTPLGYAILENDKKFLIQLVSRNDLNVSTTLMFDPNNELYPKITLLRMLDRSVEPLFVWSLLKEHFRCHLVSRGMNSDFIEKAMDPYTERACASKYTKPIPQLSTESMNEKTKEK